LVELCEKKLLTYYIDHPNRIISQSSISHFNFHTKEEKTTQDFLGSKTPLRILMTSGASCPDALVEDVIKKLTSYFVSKETYEKVSTEIIS
jgi:4-hydroxy-3-methylbut-2-enyl diphosphate reductase